MPVDLGPLAFDVFVDARPDDFAADEMLGGPDASMLVVCIEESPAEGRRDVWSWVAEGDIAEQVVAGVWYLDSLKAKGSLALYERNHGRVLALFPSDQVNSLASTYGWKCLTAEYAARSSLPKALYRD